MRNRIMEEMVSDHGKKTTSSGTRFAKDIKEFETNYEDGKFCSNVKSLF